MVVPLPAPGSSDGFPHYSQRSPGCTSLHEFDSSDHAVEEHEQQISLITMSDLSNTGGESLRCRTGEASIEAGDESTTEDIDGPGELAYKDSAADDGGEFDAECAITDGGELSTEESIAKDGGELSDEVGKESEESAAEDGSELNDELNDEVGKESEKFAAENGGNLTPMMPMC